ncbi:M20/M25/M40 family metallo-hydrolase [Paracoccus aminophilus]|uniref:Peptidase M20 n=1 Tax=Paracoccus aminophilus JCM 7686 TaxID=1367847 RepID=S5YT89_PARAH|nr:M20/M25/M40 family metallo-hydrolase [Paracoccus aminophilus]AGT08441.1 peptidase M20 [Paracoccus aminophilus JCM 7686]
MAPAPSLEHVLEKLDAGLPQALDRLLEFLRIPSISTDPAFAPDVRRAAEWLCRDLVELGFDASIRDTPGHPMVVAHSQPGSGRKLLFYGHYDVQPVDPLNLWDNPPFEPRLEDTPAGEVIRGRGSSDDKGQLMTFVEACRAWKAVNGELPPGLVLLFEGEEESGSPSLRPFLHDNAAELHADIAAICDTSRYSDGRPAITTQLRGLYGEEITLRAADRDLHSGSFGGLAANPLQILCNAFAGLKDANGRITLPGFYDGVAELPEALRRDWDSLGFDPAEFLGGVGLKDPIGEKGRGGLEMIWSQPTFEINGMSGGYTGEGFKTVLPGEANAKVSFRLVGQQDPDKIQKAFRAYMAGFIPADCEISYKSHGGSPASHMNISDPAFAAAKQALTEEWGRDAAYIGAGGSIPIAGDFQQILKMDTMLIGFAKDDDRIHSPNEKYDVESFAKGARSWARILAALA